MTTTCQYPFRSTASSPGRPEHRQPRSRGGERCPSGPSRPKLASAARHAGRRSRRRLRRREDTEGVAPTSWAATCSAGAGRGRDMDRLVGRRAAIPVPVYVLTHHEREPLQIRAARRFTSSPDDRSALEQRARRPDKRSRSPAAQRRAAVLAGRAARRAVTAHRPDRPRRRRAAARGVGDPSLEPVEVVASPAVQHVRYRVGGAR